MAGRRLVIVGAGPVGLEAAVRARLAGWQTLLFEQGTVGHHLTDWGHVRLFSPFGMNASTWGRGALAARSLPGDDALLTGCEFVDQYLRPLSKLPLLDGCIREHTRVIAISRTGRWKSDQIGQAARSESPFRLLVETQSAGAAHTEEVVEADIVLDCSGTFSHHNWLGAGGIPCPGERRHADRIDYRVPDISGADRDRFAGQTVLVVGSGYSAATSVVALSELAADDPDTHCYWLTRTGRTPPIPHVESDPLAGRAALTEAANRLACESEGTARRVTWIRNAVVDRIRGEADGRLGVSLHSQEDHPAERGPALHELTVDRIVAQVGYQPDRDLYEELQVHECYATQGPIRLAAKLLGESSADCLAQTASGADVLSHPEPGFFVLGAKSYGRDSRFLMRMGLQQIETVLSHLEGCRE